MPGYARQEDRIAVRAMFIAENKRRRGAFVVFYGSAGLKKRSKNKDINSPLQLLFSHKEEKKSTLHHRYRLHNTKNRSQYSKV